MSNATAVLSLVENTNEVPMSEKKPQPTFNLNYILDRACANPENFEEYQAWQQADMALFGTEEKRVPYSGWMRYEIHVHCMAFTVVAKRAKNGGYHIQKYIEREI